MFSEQVVTDHRCDKWVLMSSCNPNKVREMVTHLGTHLFLKDNKLMINHRLSYKLPLHLI